MLSNNYYLKLGITLLFVILVLGWIFSMMFTQPISTNKSKGANYYDYSYYVNINDTNTFNNLRNPKNIYTNKLEISNKIFEGINSIELFDLQNKSLGTFEIVDSTFKIPEGNSELKYEIINSIGNKEVGNIYFDNSPIKILDIKRNNSVNPLFVSSFDNNLTITTNKPALYVTTTEGGYFVRDIKRNLTSENCQKYSPSFNYLSTEENQKCTNEWLESNTSTLYLNSIDLPKTNNQINIEIYDYYGNKFIPDTMKNITWDEVADKNAINFFPSVNYDFTNQSDKTGLILDNLNISNYEESGSTKRKIILPKNKISKLNFKAEKYSTIEIEQSGNENKLSYEVSVLGCSHAQDKLVFNGSIQQFDEICDYTLVLDTSKLSPNQYDISLNFTMYDEAGNWSRKYLLNGNMFYDDNGLGLSFFIYIE